MNYKIIKKDHKYENYTVNFVDSLNAVTSQDLQNNFGGDLGRFKDRIKHILAKDLACEILNKGIKWDVEFDVARNLHLVSARIKYLSEEK